jgi:hypothetical protein
MTGITALVATAGFPLVTVIRNNEAEYQATGDTSALLGHPFDRLTGTKVAHLAANSKDYAKLIAQYPDLRLNADDSPEQRALKIEAINARWKTMMQLQIGAANENEAQIRKQLYAITNDPRTLKDDPRTPGIGYRPTADDIKRIYPGEFDLLAATDWDRILPRPNQPAAMQLAAAEALASAARAKRQAIAETYVNAPITAQIRVEAFLKDHKTHVHISRRYTLAAPITFFPVELSASPPTSLLLLDNSDELLSTGPGPLTQALQGTPETLTIRREIFPLFLEGGQVATFKGFAVIWDGDEWGLVPVDQYRNAQLPEKENLK